MNSVRLQDCKNLGLKNQRFTPSGGKNIGIRKSKFVTIRLNFFLALYVLYSINVHDYFVLYTNKQNTYSFQTIISIPFIFET